MLFSRPNISGKDPSQVCFITEIDLDLGMDKITSIVFSWYIICHPYLTLTHLGRVIHICISKFTTIGSDDGLLSVYCQAIIWTNAGILLIESLGTQFSEIVIKIHIYAVQKMLLKMSSVKWWPFCFGINVLTAVSWKHHYVRSWVINYNGGIWMYLWSSNYLFIWFTMFSIKSYQRDNMQSRSVTFVGGTKQIL